MVGCTKMVITWKPQWEKQTEKDGVRLLVGQIASRVSVAMEVQWLYQSRI